jgi:hypothetical protein
MKKTDKPPTPRSEHVQPCFCLGCRALRAREANERAATQAQSKRKRKTA